MVTRRRRPTHRLLTRRSTLRGWADLRAELDGLIKPLAARRRIGQHANRPADAEPVSFLLMTVPIPRTEHGG